MPTRESFSILKGTDTDKMGTWEIVCSSLGSRSVPDHRDERLISTYCSTTAWTLGAFRRRTTPCILSLSSEVASDFHWSRSGEETTTFASTIDFGATEVGLGGNGKRSAVPVLGGVKAEIGKLGGALDLRVLALKGVGGCLDIEEEGDEI